MRYDADCFVDGACEWMDIDEDGKARTCEEPAQFASCDGWVCEAHKCRHSKAIKPSPDAGLAAAKAQGAAEERAQQGDAREALREVARRILKWREQHSDDPCAVLRLCEKTLHEVVAPVLSSRNQADIERHIKRETKP